MTRGYQAEHGQAPNDWTMMTTIHLTLYTLTSHSLSLSAGLQSSTHHHKSPLVTEPKSQIPDLAKPRNSQSIC